MDTTRLAGPVTGADPARSRLSSCVSLYRRSRHPTRSGNALVLLHRWRANWVPPTHHSARTVQRPSLPRTPSVLDKHAHQHSSPQAEAGRPLRVHAIVGCPLKAHEQLLATRSRLTNGR